MREHTRAGTRKHGTGRSAREARPPGGPGRPRRRGPVGCLAATLLLLLGLSAGRVAAADAPAGPLRGIAVRALDGDGVQVRVGERLENLRYLGVRTPVICHPITGPEAYRHQAAAANAELVEGREVTVVPAAEARDAAGRLLATVLLEGRSVGAELVRRGFAEVVTTPPHRRERRELLGVQAAAQAARAGLWADPAARRYYCPRRTGVLASPRTMSFFHVDDDKAYFEERLEVFESPEAAIEAGYTPSFDFKVHEERDWRARVRAVAETVTLPASAVVVAPPPPPPATGHIWRGGTVIPVHR